MFIFLFIFWKNQSIENKIKIDCPFSDGAKKETPKRSSWKRKKIKALMIRRQTSATILPRTHARVRVPVGVFTKFSPEKTKKIGYFRVPGARWVRI